MQSLPIKYPLKTVYISLLRERDTRATNLHFSERTPTFRDSTTCHDRDTALNVSCSASNVHFPLVRIVVQAHVAALSRRRFAVLSRRATSHAHIATCIGTPSGCSGSNSPPCGSCLHSAKPSGPQRARLSLSALRSDVSWLLSPATSDSH